MMKKIKKWIAFVWIYLCNLLPIKQNKIMLFSYYGSNYGCNPKYISQYINEHTANPFDLVWAFNEPESKLELPHVRKVKNMSWRYFYEVCTAKVVITNYRTTDLFIKRKNQYYIQTWHSSLRLKQIEKDAENTLPASYLQMAKQDAAKCDLVLSGCRFSTDIFKRAFWYDGEIFEHGTPRNDLLYQSGSRQRDHILARLQLPKGKKLLLYAPTFRAGNHEVVYDLDYQPLSQVLKEKFGGEWLVLVKLHPHLSAATKQFHDGEQVIDVTLYDDVQELLLLADILITDYSSLMFDFAITKRPCFLYTPDLGQYVNAERGLYFTITQLPFTYATNHQGLYGNIISFQTEVYQQDVVTFLDEVGSYEDGRASERLVKRLEEVCFDYKTRGDIYETV